MKAKDPGICFELRIPADPATIIIKAYDDMIPQWDEAGRLRLTCEVRQASKIIFPKGQLHCALHGASDGIEAKELVLALVSGVYGEGYTPEQLKWIELYTDHIDDERAFRYCNPDGTLKGSK